MFLSHTLPLFPQPQALSIKSTCVSAMLFGLSVVAAQLHGAEHNEYDQNPGHKHVAASTPVPVPAVSEPAESLPDSLPGQIDLAESGVDSDGLLDINTATAEQLASALPGIGPAKANNIVKWREANGPFKAIDQLLEVPGIGPRTLERLRALIRIGDAVAAAERAGRLWRKEEAVRLAVARIIDRARQDANSAR